MGICLFRDREMGWVLLSMAVIVVWRRRGGCVADCEILRGGRGRECGGGSLASVVRLGTVL